MFDRFHFWNVGTEYLIVTDSCFRSMDRAERARFEHVPSFEARSVVQLMHRSDPPLFQRMHAAVYGNEHGMGHGHFRSSGPLTGMDLSVQQVVDALGTTMGTKDGAPIFARLYVLKPVKAKVPESSESREARRVDEAIVKLGRGDVLHRGHGYVIVRAEKVADVPRRDSYETLSERESLDVLKQMSEEPVRSDQQKKALADILEMTGKRSAAVLLLRRQRFYAVEKEKERVTPSQLRKAQSHWIEIEAVDPDQQPVTGVKLELVLVSGGTAVIETNKKGLARLENMQAGNVTVRVLSVDGSAWHPVGGAAALPSEGSAGHKVHVVGRGESLALIARKYGLPSWRQLWDDAKNERLKKKRKSPHVLRPGDKVMVPALRVFEVVRSTDSRHRICVEASEPLTFRVILQDHNQLPFADEPYELSLVGAADNVAPTKGTTDSVGAVIQKLPSRIKQVRVALPKRKLSWSFGLHELTAVPDTDEQEHNGDPSAEAVKAAQIRLNALGFPCGDVDGVMGWRTRDALALFHNHEQSQPESPAHAAPMELAHLALEQLSNSFTV
jgi:hypothetical protein